VNGEKGRDDEIGGGHSLGQEGIGMGARKGVEQILQLLAKSEEPVCSDGPVGGLYCGWGKTIPLECRGGAEMETTTLGVGGFSGGGECQKLGPLFLRQRGEVFNAFSAEEHLESKKGVRRGGIGGDTISKTRVWGKVPPVKSHHPGVPLAPQRQTNSKKRRRGSSLGGKNNRLGGFAPLRAKHEAKQAGRYGNYPICGEDSEPVLLGGMIGNH